MSPPLLHPDCSLPNRWGETVYQKYVATKHLKASDDTQEQSFNVTAFTPDCALRLFTLYVTPTEHPIKHLQDDLLSHRLHCRLCDTTWRHLMSLPLIQTAYALRLFTLYQTPTEIMVRLNTPRHAPTTDLRMFFYLMVALKNCGKRAQ